MKPKQGSICKPNHGLKCSPNGLGSILRSNPVTEEHLPDLLTDTLRCFGYNLFTGYFVYKRLGDWQSLPAIREYEINILTFVSGS